MREGTWINLIWDEIGEVEQAMLVAEFTCSHSILDQDPLDILTAIEAIESAQDEQ